MANRFKEKIIKHPLFRASIVYTLTDAINKAIPFLLLPVLTYYLTPADFGITTNYNIYVNILTVFVSLSINGAFSVSFFKMSKQEASVYLSSMMVLIFLSFLAFCGITFLLSGSIKAFIPIATTYIIAGAVVSFGQCITAINLDLWRLQDKALTFGLYEIAQGLFAIIISLILLIGFRMKWESRILASVITASTFGILSLILIWKKGYLKKQISMAAIKDALSYGIPLLPYSLGVWLRFGIDRIYITKFCGQSETGVYATATQFGIIISFLTLALNNAFSPYLYRILSGDDEATLVVQKKKLVKFTYLYFLALVLASLFFIIACKFVISHVLSVKFISAQRFIPLVIASQVVQGMCLMLSLYILFVKRTGILTAITTGCGFVQLVISYFAVKNMGAIGGAYASLLTNIINLVFIWYFSARVYVMPWNIFKTKRATVGT
ncbi:MULTISPECIES: lipopolysaccharide biosynthesis protein [unclassified Mucilaginibacter]|uniref:lipopolysaccharide biosynthesis protein n=1 Tax=unclassified Mucilaginibacter TaxID=2617802 RepID=UPI0009691FB1|nr:MULTISPECIES: oligosaccharide flippase family protein [unclassified Mucilaginibacter]OJW16922.1 MAG: hypothetical protein BGO48_10765 [Mucilaginibacter sp. 44-25]PLW89252.1 MAG: hypothetical protein C0154_12510 [Mucilaginibacter sp.]HEK22125.1 hypothetical protein [Bacteroidota bacterium]